MPNTIEEFKADSQYAEVCKVYDIFSDFFGEPYVDLQHPEGETYPFILVYWPVVTVTNENDKSVEIQDLYAKIKLTMGGEIPYESLGFYLNRSTYSKVQFDSNYMHSHICSIPKGNYDTFQAPCLGHGPIKGTIGTLNNENDETTWMLFCQELAMYVTVESLRGIPYNRLENIGYHNVELEANNYRLCNNDAGAIQSVLHRIDPQLNIHDFMKYYAGHNNLSFNYVDGRYTIGIPCYDYMLDVSNAFIDFINSKHYTPEQYEQVIEGGTLNRCLAAGGKFYVCEESSDTSDDSGAFVCRFKGKDIYLKIVYENVQEAQETLILTNNIAMPILYEFLQIINYEYKGKRFGRKKTSPTAYKSVYFL